MLVNLYINPLFRVSSLLFANPLHVALSRACVGL